MYQVGQHTLSIPMSMFKENREKVVNALKASGKIAKPSETYILLQGGDDLSLYDTDVNYLFRQEAYFTYMIGVTEPGCFALFNCSSGAATLFVPRLPEDYSVWMGRLLTPIDFKNKYTVEEVFYVDEIDKIVGSKNASLILTMTGTNSDSGLTYKPASFEGIEKYTLNSDVLFPIIAECRVIKSEAEQKVLKYVCKVSSDAHKKVMKFVRPGVSEFQAESEFLHHSYSVGGCRHVSYTCICGTGDNSAILHYGHAGAPNDAVLKDGDMCLFDMGANYGGYAADITCSFPANGKFTEDQKIIYNAVLAARDAVIAHAKDGVSWVAMHRLSNKVMLEKLRDGNLVKGDIDEMIKAGINAVFQPHGLGHLIGLDVHDVGGYLEECPPKPEEPGFNKLRFARDLKAGMYVTIEPGCYFIDPLLDEALANETKSKYLVPEVIKRFRNFGGVRIEDDVLITKDGVDNYTEVPRTVEEIESWMAQ